MIKLVSFPGINQFRTVVQDVQNSAHFVGLDEDKNPIYDKNLPKPILKFTGTVKLHGSLGAVSFNNSDGMWVQSRENIITPLKDNAGFAFFVQSKKQSFKNLLERLKDKYDLNLDVYTLTIYGEWAGKNIQKNVAISDLPNKSFFIFGVKVSNLNDSEFKAYWVNSNDLRDTYNNIYNVNDYQKFEIEIDFNDPCASQIKIDALVQQVEKECPVAKEFGISGTGEGIVFSAILNDTTYIFKAKGLLHAEKKEKVKPDTDNEQIQKLQVLAEKVTPSWRLEQALEKACDFMNGGTLNRKHLGNYIQYVIADVIKEDLDVIAEENVEPKELNKYISEIARNYFFQKEKNTT